MGTYDAKNKGGDRKKPTRAPVTVKKKTPQKTVTKKKKVTVKRGPGGKFVKSS